MNWKLNPSKTFPTPPLSGLTRVYCKGFSFVNYFRQFWQSHAFRRRFELLPSSGSPLFSWVDKNWLFSSFILMSVDEDKEPSRSSTSWLTFSFSLGFNELLTFSFFNYLQQIIIWGVEISNLLISWLTFFFLGFFLAMFARLLEFANEEAGFFGSFVFPFSLATDIRLLPELDLIAIFPLTTFLFSVDGSLWVASSGSGMTLIVWNVIVPKWNLKLLFQQNFWPKNDNNR